MSERVQHDEQCLSFHDRWRFRYDERCSSLHAEGLKAIVRLVGNKLVCIRQLHRKCTIVKLKFSLH